MNKTQLEQIRNHIAAIRKLLVDDEYGIIFLESAVTELEKLVVRELRSIVWGEYEQKRGNS